MPQISAAATPGGVIRSIEATAKSYFIRSDRLILTFALTEPA